jgi:hypothetical protein
MAPLELVSSLAAQVVKAVHGRREEDRIAAVGAIEEALSDDRCYDFPTMDVNVFVFHFFNLLRLTSARMLAYFRRAADICSALMVRHPTQCMIARAKPYALSQVYFSRRFDACTP